MRKIINKTMVVVLTLISSISLAMPTKAEALEPRLLWEKTMPFKIGGIKMASLSGDVILASRDERQIILYDKDGNKRFHWGPRIDRQPMGIDISDDGSVVLFETTFTEEYLEKKNMQGQWDKRIHYATRKGKELWNKDIGGTALLSPDGKMVLNYPSAGEGEHFLTALDAQGKFLWKYPFSSSVATPIFSPDGNYIGFTGGVTGGIGGILLDKSGNLLWKKLGIDIDGDGSVSDGANYIVDYDHKKVYDKQGNLVFEGDTYVSGDGKRLLVWYPEQKKVNILSLPDKTVIREYLGGGFISHDGRFLISTSPSGNQLIIDTINKVSSEIPISNALITRILHTKDGKYLLIVVNEKKILYYQIY